MPLSIRSHPEVISAIRLLEAWIDSQMAYRGLPGMSIGVVYDQDLIWSRGFGYADRAAHAPATPQTIYRQGSVTKLFSSTAIMQLRDCAALRLDDSVQEHLPWFNIQSRHLDTPVITIRHLLTHTSQVLRRSRELA
jgi:D-alanyl-D-alanine carboxypeptidase